MLIRNYSGTGWRVYALPNFLKLVQRDGYKELARLEKLNNIEILIQQDKVYVRDKFESRYGE